jgi:hypothetical protein
MFGRRAFLIAAATSFSMSALAAAPVVYPAKGQSQSKQQSDTNECSGWAKNNTGIDPAALASSPPPQQTGSTVGSGDRARGAARGAVGGAVIGEIASGDASHGAAVGAGAGAVAGGARARRNQAAQNQAAVGQQQQQMDTYYRAFAACMQGRGYTVN